MDLMDPGRSAFTWSIQEVGFLDPNSDTEEDFPHIEMGSRSQNSPLIFRNVNAFISHIHGMLVFKDEVTIRTNIHLCLRGAALEWYITELTDQDRESLRLNEVESPLGWLQRLSQRFNLSPKVNRLRLTNGFGMSSYVREGAHQVIRYAQALGIHNTDDQLSLIWKFIKLNRGGEEMDRLLTKPLCGVSIEEFMRTMDVAAQENQALYLSPVVDLDHFIIEEEPKKQ